VEPEYAFDPQKNGWLVRERGISFEQIIALIETSKLIQVLEHPNAERYPNQLLYEVDVGGYVHVVPVVREGRTLFLKTIYPSRKATRKRRKGEPHEKARIS
jgi:uncharacterized DUF497 family protein